MAAMAEERRLSWPCRPAACMALHWERRECCGDAAEVGGAAAAADRAAAAAYSAGEKPPCWAAKMACKSAGDEVGGRLEGGRPMSIIALAFSAAAAATIRLLFSASVGMKGGRPNRKAVGSMKPGGGGPKGCACMPKSPS